MGISMMSVNLVNGNVNIFTNTPITKTEFFLKLINIADTACLFSASL